MKKNFYMFVYRSLLVVTFSMSVLICLGAASHAQENLFTDVFPASVRLMLLLLLSAMICLFVMRLYHCFDQLSQRWLAVSAGIMFGIMAVIFTVILCCFRSIPYSDALNVQDMAMYFAETGNRPLSMDVADADYFGRYPNNYFLTILLSYFFRMLLNLGIHEFYVPLQILTTAGIIAAAFFTYLIGVKAGGLRAGAKVMALCVLNPVYYVLVLWVYTNVLSIPFMMAVVYFGICIYQEKRMGRLVVFCILEAVISVAGYFIRPTAVIPLIALVLCGVLWAARNREALYKFLKCLAVCGVAGILLFRGISGLNESYFSAVSDNNFPITHWLMMGSHGEGKIDNSDVEYTESYDTKEEKTRATLKKMVQNYKEKGKAETAAFFCGKLIYSWSYGDGIEIIPKAAQDTRQTALYSWILGNRQDLFRLYCYAFRTAEMILILAALWSLLRKDMDACQFVFVLSLFGGMLFYLIWEVKGSYTAPFIYIMLLIGMEGGSVLADKVPAIGERMRRRKRYMATFAVFACILCVCLLSFYRLTTTSVVRQDWSLCCYGKRSLRDIREEGGVKELSQEFYAEKPVNRLGLRMKADEEAKRSNAGYRVSIEDEKKQVVYSGEIHAEDILPDQRVVLPVRKIVPDKRQRYLLKLERLEGREGTLLLKQRSNESIDTYSGVLTVNGKKRMNDLYLQVYREYQAKWCSKKAGAVICGSLFLTAVFLYLWIFRSGRKEDIYESDERIPDIIYRYTML